MHSLEGRDLAKAVGVGVATAIVLSIIMVTGLKTGISPMPKPLALAFASTLLGRELPLPVGLLFHLVWVTLWSVLYVKLFWNRLSFSRALGLGLALWALVLVAFFPYVGWGFFGLGIGPMLIVAALVSHVLFAIVLWALAHWVFGTEHPPQPDRMSHA
jgi:hypothetical protein